MKALLPRQAQRAASPAAAAQPCSSSGRLEAPGRCSISKEGPGESTTWPGMGPALTSTMVWFPSAPGACIGPSLFSARRAGIF